jgi:soluble cytochrome b562
MATSLDWTAKQRGSVTEYEQGYRHALDAILGYLDDLQSGLIEENVLTAKQAMEKK